MSTGVLGELGVVSEGVGYTLPFEVLAAEWIDPERLADQMNALHLPGVIFRPITFKPFYGRSTGVSLHGVQAHFTDPRSVDLLGLQFLFMQVHHALYPDKDLFQMAGSSRLAMFDRVMGTSRIREVFTQRYVYDDVRTLMEREEGTFKATAKRYWLY